MKSLLILALLIAVPLSALGQDVSWLLDEAPVVSMVLVKVLDQCPSFSAKADIYVSGQADPSPSAATGAVEFQAGNLRWAVNLKDIASAQLSQNARAAVRQINGERFLLITRSDQKANNLVLPGARACVEQPLPAVRLAAVKSKAVTEQAAGRTCSKERLRAVRADGTANEVVVWRATDLKNLPVQIQFTDSGETIQVRFRDLSVRPIPSGQFRLSEGLSRYSSVEDMVQSVLLDRVKKRIGL
jgi:hypothetical protein